MKEHSELSALAQQMEGQFQVIQRHMRQELQAEFARGNLTGPQMLVMKALLRMQGSDHDPIQGLSLKQLSDAVSLAHSTVSGIVDRLEKQGLVERRIHPKDRRVSLLVASRPVREFLKTRMPELSLHPFLEVLERATRAQRLAISTGFDTLVKLLP